jgi:hypothetical protein
MMKRILIIRFTMLMLMLITASGLYAQDDLMVGKLFEQYGHAKGCKMVELHHGSFKGYELETYKSLIYKNIGSQIANYLDTDRKNAKKVREIVEDGQVMSGYYMMKPIKSGINRYILFRKNNNQSGTVIYIEGSLSPEELMKLCTITRKR